MSFIPSHLRVYPHVQHLRHYMSRLENCIRLLHKYKIIIRSFNRPLPKCKIIIRSFNKVYAKWGRRRGINIRRKWCVKWRTWWCISRIRSFNAHSIPCRSYSFLVMIMMLIMYITYSFIYHFASILY